MIDTTNCLVSSFGRARLLGAILPCVLFAACSGSDGTIAPNVIRCADSGASPSNSVTLQCAGASSSEEFSIDVELGGPASGTTTLRGVTLDIVWTPANVEFVAEPAYTSPLMPNALVVVDLFQATQGRLVVSMLQPGGEPDVSVGPGPSALLRLRFRRTTSTEFGPVGLGMENTAAIGASSTIQFGAGLTLLNE